MAGKSDLTKDLFDNVAAASSDADITLSNRKQVRYANKGSAGKNAN